VAILLDTSGLLCLFHAAEPQHDAAVTFFDVAPFKLTTNYVLAEFVALAYVRRLPRQQTLAFMAALQDSPEVSLVYVDELLHRRALSLLQHHLDKNWSLCDAVSFELMRQHHVAEALTTDHHFEQAGFVRLLAS